MDTTVDYPDLYDFTEGITALKDLYRCTRWYVNPDQGEFVALLQQAHGFSWYDEETDAVLMQREHPFYHPEIPPDEQVAAIVPAPFASDLDRSMAFIRSMWSHKRLVLRPPR